MHSKFLSGCLCLLFIGMALGLTGKEAYGMKPSHENARRIKRVYQAQYVGTSEQVFPLLCPVLEYDWLEHWKADILYTESGVAEMDCIFRTCFDPEAPQVWTVIRYEPNRCIKFLIVNQYHVTRYTIILQNHEDGTSSGMWEQVITALNPEGDAYLDTLTESVYAARQENIARRLNYYLETGKMYHDAEH